MTSLLAWLVYYIIQVLIQYNDTRTPTLETTFSIDTIKKHPLFRWMPPYNYLACSVAILLKFQ